MATVTQNVTKQLRSDISGKINRLPMAYYNKTATGDVLSRVTNDVDMISQSMRKHRMNVRLKSQQRSCWSMERSDRDWKME